MRASEDIKMENSIRGVRYTILFYLSLPFWVLFPFVINSEPIAKNRMNDLWVNGLGYGIIFIVSCITLLNFYSMSKEMMKGDFYSIKSIQKLYRGSQSLQLTGLLLILWSFISKMVTHNEDKVFFSYEFCSGYFLIILSVIFWYVSKSLKKGQLLKSENELTI